MESCDRHTDALEPFFHAARGFLALHAACEGFARTDEDCEMSPFAAGASRLGESAACAAPAWLRHCVRCCDGELCAGRANAGAAWRDKVAALELLEQLATSTAARAQLQQLHAPVAQAVERATHDSNRRVRDAAKRCALALELVASQGAAKTDRARALLTQQRRLTQLLGERLQHTRPHADRTPIWSGRDPAHSDDRNEDSFAIETREPCRDKDQDQDHPVTRSRRPAAKAKCANARDRRSQVSEAPAPPPPSPPPRGRHDDDDDHDDHDDDDDDDHDDIQELAVADRTRPPSSSSSNRPERTRQPPRAAQVPPPASSRRTRSTRASRENATRPPDDDDDDDDDVARVREPSCVCASS